MTDIIYPELSYQIQGAIYNTYNDLCHYNLTEAGWEAALMLALINRNLEVDQQVEYQCFYKECCVGRFFVDLLVEQKIALELKNKLVLTEIDRAQILMYLKVSQLKLGILVNFGVEKLSTERFPNFFQKWENRSSPVSSKQLDETLLFPDLTYQLRSASYEVHAELGPGFIHATYRRAVKLELTFRDIPYNWIRNVKVAYHGQEIESCPVWLLIVDEKVLFSVVASKGIDKKMIFDMKFYLDYFGLNLGMIVNFHGTSIQIESIPSLPRQHLRSKND